MRKQVFMSIFFIFCVSLLQAQKKYEVLKIEKNELENMNVIYLKKMSVNKDIYRIVTRKSDTLIMDKKEISVGCILKLNLVKTKEIIKDNGHGVNVDKKSFFYSDTYNGQNVNIKYYCHDFIGLYYVSLKQQ